MIDTKIKYFSVFYSKNANLVLSKKVKDFFDKNSSYTEYSQDIDEIILKKYSKIDFLILDFTNCILDEHSIMLLEKLNKTGYIKQIIAIFDCLQKIPKEFIFKNIILDDEDLNKNLKDEVNKFKLNKKEENLYYDANWVKIIAEYLSSIGFSENKNGFMLIIDTLIYCLSKKDFSTNFSKNVFPYLASKYKVKISAIEMRIRSAISTASKRDKFPFDICPSIKQFTNYALTRIYSKIYSKGVINDLQVS